MEKHARIYVAGAQTLIGGALRAALERQGFRKLAPEASPDPDATSASEVDHFFAATRPEYVFVAAGRQGGIAANQRQPAELMLDNLLSAAHLVDAAHRHRVKKLLFLASSCSYPRLAPQPMQPASLGSGPLEPTNEAYAMAKLAGLKLCEAYRQQYGDRFVTAIPANAFGPGDDFDPERAHVIGALIRKMHEAKAAGAPFVEIWGTGNAQREFIFADDLADACLMVMDRYEGPGPINLGTGKSHSIAELAREIARVVGFTGELRFDESRPDGMPRKSLDSEPLRALGFRRATPFADALGHTYRGFLDAQHAPRAAHVG